MTRIKKNYHWVIAAVALLQLFFYTGASNNFTNLHLIPVSEHLGISRGDFSVAFSVKNLISMLTTFVSGAIVLKFGYRKVAGISMLLSTAAYLLLAFCLDSYLSLFLYCSILGATNAFCSASGATLIVSNWFHKHRGLVLGIVTAASGLGGSILCLAQTAAIEAFTWRGSFVLAGSGIGIGGILICLLVRNTPEEKGLVPLGEGEEIISKKKKASQEAREGLSLPQLFHRPSFYLMILLTFLSCLCAYILFLVVVPHLQDQGFSATEASMVNSFMMLILAFFKLAIGWLADKIGAKKVQLICMCFMGIGLILFGLAKSLAVAYLAAVCFSVALSVTTVMVPLLSLTLFGYKAQPQYTGIFMGMISGSSMVGGMLSNYLFDSIGSYTPGLVAAGIVGFALIPLYLVLYRLTEKDKEYENTLAQKAA